MPAWKVFFSYSEKDEELRQKLAAHLAVLQHNGRLETWCDRQIPVGSDWDKAIHEKLESADLIVFLISADFLASNYCFDVEMKRAFERLKEGSARIAPILLRPCAWQESIFSDLECLPRKGKPITSWPNIDEAFADITTEISAIVKEPFPASVLKTVRASINGTETDLTIVREQIIAYARLYERTRQCMPPSNERTERLQSIFEKMCSLAMASFPLLRELATSPSPGDKLAALSILQYFANAEYLPFLVRVIEKEKPFVGYHAAKALEFAVSALDSIYTGEVSLAIEEAIIRLEKSDPGFDSDRLKILRRAKQSLAVAKAALAADSTKYD